MRTHIRNSATAALIALVGLATTSVAAAQDRLLDVAESAGLTILVDAVEAAGLTETLNSDGPFTVFAPTNEAFVELLGDLDLSAEELFADTELLTAVLTYHVVPGALDGEAVIADSPLTTVQGEGVQAALRGETVVINGNSNVALPNVGASNGIAHVIDKVLLPPSITGPTFAFSLNADRSGAAPLDGANLQIDDENFVFVAPAHPGNSVFFAVFYLNNQFVNFDSRAPFDLFQSHGTPLPLPMDRLVEGENTVSVVLFTLRGQVHRSATFTVADEREPKLLEVAEDAGLTILVDAVEAAGLTDTLNSDGPFTVFAPTNEAFITLLGDFGMTAEELFADTELLTEVLLYHVVADELDAPAVLASSPIETVQGDTVDAELGEDGETVILNGDTTVLLANVGAANGIAHVIDKVLLPPPPAPLQISFSTNADRGDAVALDGAVLDGGVDNFAFLTPLDSDEVFASLFFLNGRFVTADFTAPYDVFSNGDEARPLRNLLDGTNELIAVAFTTQGIQFRYATFEVATADPKLLDVAEDAGLTILVEAVEAAGLTETLNSDGPFTVFAPTNEAFVELLGNLNMTKEELFADTELLTRVLTYHVLIGAFDGGAVLAGSPLTTFQGSVLFSELDGETVVLNGGINVVLPNVPAANGIAHVIDTVLLPPTLLEVAELAGLTILVDAVEAAGLTETLNSPGPFTVFAPTNEAFVTLLSEQNLTVEELFDDTALLTNILTYHVLVGEFDGAAVVGNSPLTSFQGAPITAELDGDTVVLNGFIEVVGPNIQTGNGIAHVINSVLIPPMPRMSGDQPSVRLP